MIIIITEKSFRKGGAFRFRGIFFGSRGSSSKQFSSFHLLSFTLSNKGLHSHDTTTLSYSRFVSGSFSFFVFSCLKKKKEKVGSISGKKSS